MDTAPTAQAQDPLQVDLIEAPQVSRSLDQQPGAFTHSTQTPGARLLMVHVRLPHLGQVLLHRVRIKGITRDHLGVDLLILLIAATPDTMTSAGDIK